MPGEGKTIYFLFNLLQDVNIVRGLVYLAARETEARIGFLVSQGFIKRDRQQMWQREVADMARDTGASIHLYADAPDARAVLAGGSGMIFAASESSLKAHWETGDVFRIAPADYLRVTLQHGFECVGFLQSREHVMAHGRDISFAADVVCGWFDASALTSLSASQRSKLVVTGSPALLQKPPPGSAKGASAGGLVCENLHSVRLKASGDHKSSFMHIFFEFCAVMAGRDQMVTLRPHPGGQYVLKNNVPLPANVELNTAPIFDVDLKAFSFGISAPSTIVLDMVLAGIPVGLWRDPGGVMDASNWAGLTEISSLEDWIAFERDVRLRPEMILNRQSAFLQRLAMPTDPQEVYRRFARLIVAGLAGSGPAPAAGQVADRRPRPARLAGDVLVEAEA